MEFRLRGQIGNFSLAFSESVKRVSDAALRQEARTKATVNLEIDRFSE